MQKVDIRLFFLAVLVISACSLKPTQFEWSSEPLSEREDYYFSYELFRVGQPPEVDTVLLRRISDSWREFEEESFYYDSLPYDAFRFAVNRIFQKPYLIRVEKRDDRGLLFSQEIIAGWPGDLDSLTPEFSTNLSLDYWKEMLQIFEEIEFWENRKLVRPIPQTCGPGPTITEGWLNGRHMVVTNGYLPPEANHRIDSLIKALVIESYLFKHPK